MGKKECAKVLLKDLAKLRDSWDESSNFKLGGIDDLSISDLDTIELYANTYIENFCAGFDGLVEPFGKIKKMLDKYNIF